MGITNSLYIGNVHHKRFHPRSHKFNNRVFFIKFALKDIQKLKGTFFSINRWNLLSFWNCDHGYRNNENLENWAKQKLLASGVVKIPTDIALMTFPRVLGYVFNPVSFWFCYENDVHFATIAEVNNTFGQTHCYVIDSEQKPFNKEFHVSLFFRIEGYYKFRFDLENKETIQVHIDYFKENICQISTYIKGRALTWSTKNILKIWILNPLMTFSVIFFIHWQALRLFFKKIPFNGTRGD